jgi:hypothetical protein
MFSKRWAPVVMAVALAALLGWGVMARPQLQPPPPLSGNTRQGPPSPFPPVQNGEPTDQDSQMTQRMRAKQAEKRNEERQQELVQDTDRLFDLAKELKDQVGKTNQNILSVDVVKKADEIEKLAKSVSSKMKAN